MHLTRLTAGTPRSASGAHRAAFLFCALLTGAFGPGLEAQPLSSFVDPFIGSRGKGNVFVGPARPFGLVKPGPDCDLGANSGYVADQAVPVFGFSQTHVSGTGGGPKYGNISLFPFVGEFTAIHDGSLRADEQARAGYYGVTLTRYGVHVELAATERAALHRYVFTRSGRA